MSQHKISSLEDIVVVAWDGMSIPLQHISFDAAPQFRLVLFDYSGELPRPAFPDGKSADEVISANTEFKGKLIETACRHLAHKHYRYVGLLDDDQAISVSALNRLLDLADQHGADVFHPSVDPGSHYSHARFVQRAGAGMESIDWIEIMSPFLRKEIFEAGQPFYETNISSYGIDRYVFPYLQRKLNRKKTFLVHDVAIRHLKPVTDGNKIFSNGMDARQEGERTRSAVLEHIKKESISFTRAEMKNIYECHQIRWRKLKYDLKRTLGR